MWAREYTWTTVMVGNWWPAGQLQGQMSCAGVEAYGCQSKRMETRFSPYVLPGDNVIGILLGLGDGHLHFAPAIHVGRLLQWRWEAVTWEHRHLKWRGRAQQDLGSHSTRIRQHGDNRVVGGAWPRSCGGWAPRQPPPHWLNSAWFILFKIRK
jgi:hypothetical protein